MNINSNPDKWIILKINHDSQTYYKVFGSWYGDKWKINSGIKNITEDEHNYYVFGFSGSCYLCSKNNYGVATSYSKIVLSDMIDKVKSNSNSTMEILDEDVAKIILKTLNQNEPT